MNCPPSGGKSGGPVAARGFSVTSYESGEIRLLDLRPGNFDFNPLRFL